MNIFNKKFEDNTINVKNDNEKDIDDLFNECIDYISTQPQKLNLIERGQMTKEKFLQEIQTHIKVKHSSVTNDQAEIVIKKIEKYIWGYHVLEELINDKDISDIKIIDKDRVRIKKFGKRYTSSVKFKSNKDVDRFINIIAIKNHINTSDINAQQIFTDKTTNKDFILRIDISTKFVNSVDHAYLHIRKIPKHKYTLEKLVELGMGSEEQIEYLRNQFKKGNSIILTGKGASGKTTLMNSLIDEIPEDKAGLVIQESEELFSDVHPEMMFQRVRYAKGEGKIEYTLKDLSINGLLTDIDYFIIGEIKDSEAKYFLNASYTGHTVMASVHGSSSTQALDKLVDYMKYESDYSKRDLMKMLSNIPIVVFMKNFKIAEISEVKGFNEEKGIIEYNQVFLYDNKISDSVLI